MTILEHWASIEKTSVNVGSIHTKLRATIITIRLAAATTSCCACQRFALASGAIDVHLAESLLKLRTLRGDFDVLIRRAIQIRGWLPVKEA